MTGLVHYKFDDGRIIRMVSGVVGEHDPAKLVDFLLNSPHWADVCKHSPELKCSQCEECFASEV